MYISSPLPASCASVTPTCHETAGSCIEPASAASHARGASPDNSISQDVEGNGEIEQPKSELAHASHSLPASSRQGDGADGLQAQTLMRIRWIGDLQ